MTGSSGARLGRVSLVAGLAAIPIGFIDDTSTAFGISAGLAPFVLTYAGWEFYRWRSERRGPSADQVRKDAANFAHELYDFLGERRSSAPSGPLDYAWPHGADEETKRRVWDTAHERSRLHGDHTVTLYQKQYRGRALSLFDAARAAGLVPAEPTVGHDTVRLNIDIANCSPVIERVAGTFDAIGRGKGHSPELGRYGIGS